MQMGRVPDELKEVLTESALYELAEFTQLWPWGEDAADVRSASLAHAIATFCQQTAKPKRFKLKTFLPFKRWAPPVRMTKEAAMDALHRLFGTKPKG